MLILPVAVYLDELLEDGRLTAVASLCKLGGIVKVAVDAALVLVVAV
jgi:hypothetical protein